MAEPAQNGTQAVDRAAELLVRVIVEPDFVRSGGMPGAPGKPGGPKPGGPKPGGPKPGATRGVTSVIVLVR